jgi:hypothetical protein
MRGTIILVLASFVIPTLTAAVPVIGVSDIEFAVVDDILTRLTVCFS